MHKRGANSKVSLTDSQKEEEEEGNYQGAFHFSLSENT